MYLYVSSFAIPQKNNHFTHEQEKQEIAKGGGHT